jgi:hypothetical protein
MSFSQTSGRPLENRPVISPKPSKRWGRRPCRPRRLRTRPSLAKGKFFTSCASLSAKLFTARAAAEEGFAVALLPRQSITLETVSEERGRGLSARVIIAARLQVEGRSFRDIQPCSLESCMNG